MVNREVLLGPFPLLFDLMFYAICLAVFIYFIRSIIIKVKHKRKKR